jgi:hypothetical protein
MTDNPKDAIEGPELRAEIAARLPLIVLASSAAIIAVFVTILPGH